MNTSRQQRTIFTWSALLIMIVLVLSPAVSQEDRPMATPEIDLPRFNLDILNFPSDSAGLSRLDVYLQVPYEMLSFVKTDDLFNASYEITIDVFDKTGNLTSEKLLNEKNLTRDYKETISSVVGKISQCTILLPPQTFDVIVQVRDVETKKIRQIKRPVAIRDFSASSFTLSDIMVIRQMQSEGVKTVLSPNIAATVKGGEEEITFYIQAQSKTLPCEATFILSLQSKLGATILSDTVKKTITKPHQSCFLKLNTKTLNAGEYTIEVKAFTRDSSALPSTEPVATVARKLSVRMPGLPFSITDLDLAINEMKYITEKDYLDSMRSAAPDQKRQLFLDFWKARDSSKGTDGFELMREYYQRVEYANKNFSHYLEGWKTDRGNIYIVFGEPSNIERHPMELDSKPYEIWTYYELNREFIFIDETGFGDYRLRDPLWDAGRTRYR